MGRNRSLPVASSRITLCKVNSKILIAGNRTRGIHEYDTAENSYTKIFETNTEYPVLLKPTDGQLFLLNIAEKTIQELLRIVSRIGGALANQISQLEHSSTPRKSIKILYVLLYAGLAQLSDLTHPL